MKMNRLMNLTSLGIILLSFLFLCNACKTDKSCQYDDNGSGLGNSYLPDYILDCVSVNLANAPSNSASGQSFNYSLFKQALFDSLPSSYGGVQYAVMQDGILHLSDANGEARGFGECPQMDLTACNKMNIASVTKMMTAAATLKLLEEMNMDETAAIGPYLPSSWGVPAAMANLTFQQMLSHRSGLHEFTANNSFDTTLSYEGLKTLAQNGPNVDSIGLRRYRNANAAMMRIIIPQLWKNVASCPIDLKNTQIIDDATSQKYYDRAIKEFIFDPVGADGELDATNLGDFETLYYDAGIENGRSTGNWKNKTGGGGWNMTAEDMARVEHGIFDGTIVSTDIADAMRSKAMGIWNFITVDDGSLIGHGGDINYGDAELHNLLVHNRNSNMTIAVNINMNTLNGGGLYLIVQNAYNSAWE